MGEFGLFAKAIEEKIWTVLVEALVNQRSLKMMYRRFDSKIAKRYVINPYHIANLQGEWYVFGIEDESDDIRQYSIARIQSCEITNSIFEFPHGFDPKKLLSRAFGRLAAGSEIHKVRLRFDKDLSDWVILRFGSDPWSTLITSCGLLSRRNGLRLL